LIVYREHCYQIDRETTDIEFIFELTRTPKAYWWMAVPASDGSIYCSVSGQTVQADPLSLARFGARGAVVRVDHRRDSISVVAEGGAVVDPFGLELIGKNQLLVSDFNGWGGSGYIGLLDLRTGASEALAFGGTLVDPQMATLDETGKLWVANAMHRHYDGEIVCVESGNRQTVVYPRHGPGSGIVSGVFPSGDPATVLFVIIDWPFMANSAVVVLEKSTGKTNVLLGASESDPKLYNAHGVVIDGTLWIGESYNNEILAVDVTTGEIVQRIDVSGILGASKGKGVRGIIDSFDFLECITVVPKLSSGLD